jgi:hypothetical protein
MAGTAPTRQQPVSRCSEFGSDLLSLQVKGASLLEAAIAFMWRHEITSILGASANP